LQNLLGLGKFPTKYGSCTHAVPGYDIQVVDDDGKLLERGKLGNLVIKLPLPPGAFTTLHLDDAKCKRVYFERFPGFYNTGDAGIIDKEGYLHVLSRTDDVINVSGIRLSTGAVEEVLASHQDVAECCVVGPRDNLKVCLFVLSVHRCPLVAYLILAYDRASCLWHC
jgi:propionyl-CoA synthetase